MGRKSYDRQFKMAAVKLVLEDNMSVSEVARELSIHRNSLYRWISEFQQYGESVFPGHGSALYNSQFELIKLKRENEYLKAELGLLKKFRGFLKKKNV